MSLELLQAELDSQKRASVQRLRQEAESASAQIESDAREKAAALIADARQKAVAESSRKSGDVYAAKLAGKKMLSEAQQAAVEQVFDDVRAELRAIANSREYPEILERLTKRAIKQLGSSDFVLRGRKADATLLAKWGKIGPPVDALGGVRVETADGKLAMNATFDALLESHAEDVRQRAFKDLFGKSKLELELPVEATATAALETTAEGRLAMDAPKRKAKTAKKAAKPKTKAKTSKRKR